ncbi:unnamed protein product [Amoebophrya sp. A25]|nr:unnamed protein product [Amoebophrya sp. A25]|eukprot:GSA25T00001969001.1
MHIYLDIKTEVIGHLDTTFNFHKIVAATHIIKMVGRHSSAAFTDNASKPLANPLFHRHSHSGERTTRVRVTHCSPEAAAFPRFLLVFLLAHVRNVDRWATVAYGYSKTNQQNGEEEPWSAHLPFVASATPGAKVGSSSTPTGDFEEGSLYASGSGDILVDLAIAAWESINPFQHQQHTHTVLALEQKDETASEDETREVAAQDHHPSAGATPRRYCLRGSRQWSENPSTAHDVSSLSGHDHERKEQPQKPGSRGLPKSFLQEAETADSAAATAPATDSNAAPATHRDAASEPQDGDAAVPQTSDAAVPHTNAGPVLETNAVPATEPGVPDAQPEVHLKPITQT